MFEIEARNMLICSCKISDEDEQRIREYIFDNLEKFQYRADEEAIIQAVNELQIDLYKDYVESDSYTESIEWSSFEERNPEDILNKISDKNEIEE